MDGNVTVQGLAQELDKDLTLVEGVEIRQLLFEKMLDELISNCTIRDPLDTMSIPIQPLDWSDKIKVLGEFPYYMTLVMTAEDFNIDPQLAKKAERSYNTSLDILSQCRPDLPYKKLGDFVVGMGKSILEYWQIFQERKEQCERDQQDPSYSLFINYIEAYATEYPESYRSALCSIFKLWIDEDLEIEEDLSPQELTPLERTEFFNIQVEGNLKKFAQKIGSGEYEFYKNPIFRRRYFGDLIQSKALIYDEQHKRDKDELRIEKLEDLFEMVKSEFNFPFMKGNIKEELLDMLDFYAEKIGYLFWMGLRYYYDLGTEKSNAVSSIYGNYMLGNAVEHAEDFRSAACSVYKMLGGN